MLSQQKRVPTIPEPKAHILFVEDESALAVLGKMMLECLGYEVVTEDKSQEALDTFLADPDRFNLVITDMIMPEMTGIDLSREILRIRPDMPIILCSGMSSAMNPEKAREIGIRAVIMKPILAEELLLTIEKVLDLQEGGNV